MIRNEIISVLEKYIPPPAAPLAADMINHYKAHVKITKSRSTKMGDYRHPHRGEGHRISVNHNLNPFAFLITLVHEFAHLSAYNDYKNQVKPHGPEWKRAFQTLMQPFIQLDIFPDDLNHYLNKYLANPAASSCSDLNLMRVLDTYNAEKPGIVYVEDLPLGQFFFTLDGRCFKKGPKRRTRFTCEEVSSKRIYLFSPLAKVRTEDSLSTVPCRGL